MKKMQKKTEFSRCNRTRPQNDGMHISASGE